MSRITNRIYAITDSIDWSAGWEKISEQWMSACQMATREVIDLEFRARMWKVAAVAGWCCAAFLATCLVAVQL